ncbi:MAG: hypothetical protein R8M45_11955 [Ghiorsea sp.]
MSDELRTRAAGMETLDLDMAAALLWMSSSGLRKRAAIGDVPGAFKLGKAWVFIKVDLLEWARLGCVAQGLEEAGGGTCQYSSVTESGMSTSKSKAQKQYDNLLGLKRQPLTKPQLVSITTK